MKSGLHFLRTNLLGNRPEVKLLQKVSINKNWKPKPVAHNKTGSNDLRFGTFSQFRCNIFLVNSTVINFTRVLRR